MSLKEKVLENIEKYGLINNGDGIVIGISGGPDSICLLHILNSIKDLYSLRIYGAHLNHNFRGEDSRGDADYVEETCKNWGIPVFSQSIDVSSYISARGMSSEEGGRELRYQLFEGVRKLVKADKIAIAQNLNDQAETILMRFIRGTSLQGLIGMEFVRDGYIIRPLLNVDRKEIEEYCGIFDLMPRIDKTNMETIYTRNKIRLDLIPYIKRELNSNIIETIVRSSQLLADDNRYLEEAAKEKLQQSTIDKVADGYVIDIRKLQGEDISIKRRIIVQMAEDINKGINPLEYKHIEDILNLVSRGVTGKTIDLPQGMVASISYNNLILRKKPIENEIIINYTYHIDFNAIIYIREIGRHLRTTIITLEEYITKKTQNKFTAFFDADVLSLPMEVRNRRNGDRFIPLGMNSNKKLKDYFIDSKIAREERERIPLLISGNYICWIIGYRTSDIFKISDSTKKVLMVELTE